LLVFETSPLYILAKGKGEFYFSRKKARVKRRFARSQVMHHEVVVVEILTLMDGT